nr:helix-turn-helix domain-containing protein [Cytophagales bacterium]
MRSFLFFWLLIALVPIAQGQNIKFKSFTAEDGLSNNSINQIVNDPSGALWIGTWDGLNLYDGQNFKVFKHDPSDSTSLRGNFISQIMLDGEDRLWVQSNSTSVSRLRNETSFDNFLFPQDIQRVGVSTAKTALVEVAGERYSFDGHTFIACLECVFIEEAKPSFEKIITTFYPDLVIKDQYRDQAGNLWFATITTGLFVLPNGAENISRESFHNYTVDGSDSYSLKSNEIYAIHEDVFGNIWLGLKDGGLSMAYKQSSDIYAISGLSKEFTELPAETVRAIHQDEEGKIWLGYYNAGIYYGDPSRKDFKVLHIHPPNNPADWKRVRSLFLDSKGYMWAGTYGGLLRVSKDGKIDYFNADATPHLLTGRNYAVMEDPEENCLWVACWGGVSKFSMEKEQFVPFTGQEQLHNFKVRKIVKGNGKLWLATENNGVVLFEKGKAVILNQENGLLDNSVYSIYLDKISGNYWFSTLAGISIYHPKKGFIHQITEKEGLQSQLVYGLLEGDKHVWASTTKGIAAIDRESFQVSVLPPDEGWQSAEFSEGSYFQNERGTLFFGGVKGVNYFNPKRLSLTYDLPRLKASRRYSDHSFLAKYHYDGFEATITPILFTTNPTNKVLYRLDPLEKGWKVLPETNLVRYNDLAPGNYVLYAKNQADEQGTEVASLEIAIPMPFWKSPVFQLVMLVGLFSGIVYIRHRSNKHQRKRLESLIEERTRTIEEQKKALMFTNADLDRKNKEILEQKSNLLALHHQQKDPEFEIEKFKSFVLNQFQGPLSYVRSRLDSMAITDKSEKRNLLAQLDGLIKELKDWENLSLLDHLEDSKSSMTHLSKLFENLTGDLRTRLRKRDILLVCDYQLKDEWVEIDVLRTKMFFHCVLRELIKFIEGGTQLTIEAWMVENSTCIKIRSTSVILLQNFPQIIQSSPHVRVAEKILVDLGGSMSFDTKGEVTLQICLPYKSAHKANPVSVWSTLGYKEQLKQDTFNVVVAGKLFEIDSLVKIIDTELINLIVEEDLVQVAAVVHQLDIDALIIYNEKISQKLLDLMATIQDSREHRVGLPVIYIYEFMGYGIQEKLMDLGIDTFIQLPSSSEFIHKKLLGQLQQRKKYLEEKLLHTLVSQEEEDSLHLSPNERLVQQAMHIIKDQYANPNFRVEMLSQQLGISKIKCYRLFKEVLDTSPSDLIIKLRLQKAEHLLARKRMNVSEVGFECGFNDPKYFSKLFKKHYGTSPRSFV